MRKAIPLKDNSLHELLEKSDVPVLEPGHIIPEFNLVNGEKYYEFYEFEGKRKRNAVSGFYFPMNFSMGLLSKSIYDMVAGGKNIILLLDPDMQSSLIQAQAFLYSIYYWHVIAHPVRRRNAHLSLAADSRFKWADLTMHSCELPAIIGFTQGKGISMEYDQVGKLPVWTFNLQYSLNRFEKNVLNIFLERMENRYLSANLKAEIMLQISINDALQKCRDKTSVFGNLEIFKDSILSVTKNINKTEPAGQDLARIREVFEKNRDSIAMEISEPSITMFMLNSIQASFVRDEVSVLDWSIHGEPIVFSRKFEEGALWFAPATINRSALRDKIAKKIIRIDVGKNKDLIPTVLKRNEKPAQVEANKVLKTNISLKGIAMGKKHLLNNPEDAVREESLRTDMEGNQKPSAGSANNELNTIISLSGIDPEKKYKLNDPVDIMVNGKIKDITLRLFLRLLVMQASSTKDYEYVNIRDLKRKPCKGTTKSVPLKNIFIKDGKIVGAIHKVFQRCLDPVLEVSKNGRESYIERIGDNKVKIKNICLSADMLGEMENLKFHASSGIDAEEFKTFINELFPKGK